MAVTPYSPEQLRDALVAIFPGFKEYWEDDDNPHLESGAFTHHGLMIEFTSFFGKELATFSERQLKAFADVVNSAVGQPGALENAVATCFLEHLHQIHANKALNPFLSRQAKEKSHP